VRHAADPFAELTTDGRHMVETHTKKGTVNPKWEEHFWLLVHEPESEEMKVTVYDKVGLGIGTPKWYCTVDVEPCGQVLGKTLHPMFDATAHRTLRECLCSCTCSAIDMLDPVPHLYSHSGPVLRQGAADPQAGGHLWGP
jgi:hypothetical protein